MNIERLTMAANFLESLVIPEGRQFDLSTWDCGTSACAIGFMMRSPVFNELGFGSEELAFEENKAMPTYNGFSSWDAAVDFFEITHKESRRLFAPEYYDADAQPKDVALKIRAMLEKGDD